MFSVYGKLFSILRASFAYSGRSARKEFWLFFLFYSLMYFAALGADVTYFRNAVPTGWLLWLQELFGGREPFVWLHLIILTPAMISITIRRLHDRGLTGWWTLVYVIPLIGLVPMVAMLARAGQTGFNRFGADPLMLAGQSRQDRISAQTQRETHPSASTGDLAAAE